MTVGRRLYNVFFKRTSAYAVTILVGAVIFERTFDGALDSLWDRKNSGVSDSVCHSGVNACQGHHMNKHIQ